MGKAGQIAAGLAAAVVLALALAQLFLPRIAAGRISSRVGRYGHVRSVSVSAWPAVELLWGRADSVTVHAGSLALSPAQTSALLWEARGASRLTVTASSVREGPLSLTDARLGKRGRLLAAEAMISPAAVRAALPPGVTVRLLGSEAGRVKVSASGHLFGVGASLDAVAAASEGSLVAHPLGLLEGVRLTLFSDPHVYVTGVGAEAADGSSYRLSMSALLL